MGRRHDRHGRKGRHETWRICSRMLRWWFRMAGTNGLFLLVLLPGCRSAEDGYLAQATMRRRWNSNSSWDTPVTNKSARQVTGFGSIAVKGAGQAAGTSHRSVKIFG